MNLRDALKSCTTYPGATEAEIQAAERALDQPLADDYKRVLRASNGVEGFVGFDAYLALWHVEEIASLNVARACRQTPATTDRRPRA
jgi:vacuolar-type H+-ATPase subunit C/Vma6